MRSTIPSCPDPLFPANKGIPSICLTLILYSRAIKVHPACLQCVELDYLAYPGCCRSLKHSTASVIPASVYPPIRWRGAYFERLAAPIRHGGPGNVTPSGYLAIQAPCANSRTRLAERRGTCRAVSGQGDKLVTMVWKSHSCVVTLGLWALRVRKSIGTISVFFQGMQAMSRRLGVETTPDTPKGCGGWMHVVHARCIALQGTRAGRLDAESRQVRLRWKGVESHGLHERNRVVQWSCDLRAGKRGAVTEWHGCGLRSCRRLKREPRPGAWLWSPRLARISN